MRTLERAFALPTVVITSVILMMLLVGGLSAVTSVRRGMTDQYYNDLARSAAEAGVAYANSCVDKNLTESASSGWGYDTVTSLQTGQDCHGAAVSGIDCVNAPTNTPNQCYVYYDATNSPAVRTYFVVAPVQLLNSTSYILASTSYVKLYNSAGTNYKTYTQYQYSRSATDTRYGIATGNDTVCSIQAGKLYCWGLNDSGQVGIGTTNSKTGTPPGVLIPKLVNGFGALDSSWNVAAVATGISHTCAIASTTASITDTTKVLCWGDNSLGQYGISLTNKTVPYLVYTFTGHYAIDISGRDHNCVIAPSSTDPTVKRHYCWGKNINLQAGEKDDGTHPDPKRISGMLATRDTGGTTLTDIQQINSVSGGDSCGVNDATSMNVFCMGNADYGMLGNNTTTDSDRANWVQITSTSTTLGKAKKVVTNNGRACALSRYNTDGATTYDSNYHVWCWGSNWAYSSKYLDWRIDSGTAFYSVTNRLRAKRVHTNLTTGTRTCVWDPDVYDSAYAALLASRGDTSYTSGSFDCNTIAAASHTATNLYNAPITDIAITDYNMCIVINGIVYCSGYNYLGQLGQGIFSGPTPTNAESVCGTMASCPLQKADEALPVFGPLKGKTVSSLVGGNGHFCAITTDHLVYCWGTNAYGQLGDGTSINRATPVRSLVPREVIY